VAHRIRELRALEKDPESRCARGARRPRIRWPDCGILNGLDRAARRAERPTAKRRHVHGAH
jgi:hypothetical protein